MLEAEVRQEISHYRQLISTNSERITAHNRELAKLNELLTNLGSVRSKHNTKLDDKSIGYIYSALVVSTPSLSVVSTTRQEQCSSAPNAIMQATDLRLH